MALLHIDQIIVDATPELFKIEVKRKENDGFSSVFYEFMMDFRINNVTLESNSNWKSMNSKDLNRIKVVLVEQKKTAKWLAEQVGKDPATVSKWCTNTSQPSLETLGKIASILQVKMSELVRNT